MAVEFQHLARAQERFFDELDAEHSFKLADLKNMHANWLGKVCPFAGLVRQNGKLQHVATDHRVSPGFICEEPAHF